MRWAHLLAITLLVVVTHALWVGPGSYNMDEEFFAVQAATWGRGGPPGVGTWDVAKTPGIALVYLGIFKVAGQSLVAVHSALALCVLGTALALYATAGRLLGTAGGLATAVLFTASLQTFRSPCDTKALLTEPVTILLVSLALAVLAAPATPPGVGRVLLAGLLLGCALVVRQTTLLYAPVLVAAALTLPPAPGRQRPRLPLTLGLLAVSAAIAPALLVAYYARLGELRTLYETSIVWPSLAGSAMPLRVGLMRGAYMVPSFLLLHTPLPTVLALAYFLTRPGGTDGDSGPAPRLTYRFVAVWIAAACLEVVPSLRFLGHYFLVVIPPLCLAAGGGVAWLWARPGGRALATSVVAVAALAACVALNLDALRARVLRQEGIAAVGTESPLQRLLADVEEHAQPGDPIWIWGDFWPEVYWQTGCVPGARDLFGIVTAGYSFTRGHGPRVCYSPMAESILIDDLRSSRPRCIIDMTGSEAFMARMRTHPRPMSDFPRLAAHIRSEYKAQPGPDNTVIYLPVPKRQARAVDRE